MRYPLVWLAGIFSLGIACRAFVPVHFIIVYLLASIFLVLAILCRQPGLCFKIFFLCLVFLFGMLWFSNRLILPKAHVSRHIFYKTDNSCVLKCFVTSSPQCKYGRTIFMAEAQEVRFGRINYSTCGNVYVKVKGRLALAYGDRLILEGRLSRPYTFSSLGRINRRARVSAVNAVMNIEDPLFVIVTGHGGGSALAGAAIKVKDGLVKLIEAHVPSPASGVLEAMMLGQRSNIAPLVYQSMMKTGTVHILVVSGFNTSLVIFCVFLVLKLLRIPRSWRLLFALPLLIFYCLMAGASASIMRATIMSIVFMASYMAKREPDIYNSCALSALIILMIDPLQLFDIGCQLSFASVISIAYFYPRIKSWLGLEGKKPFHIRFFTEGLLVSFSAWLGTAGLTAYYFRTFSPITLIANVFIVPLAGLITLCGFSLVVAVLALPPVAPAFSATAQALVAILLKINAFFLGLPGAYFNLPGG